MKKANSRINKRPWKALVSISLVTSGLWFGVFYLIGESRDITGSRALVIEKVERVEVEKISDYIPSKNTLRLIELNPGVYGSIYRRFGVEARQYAELIGRESGFKPGAINPTSGACGLSQSLPCSKMDCSLDLDGVDCQLDWIEEYVVRRYGSIEHALVFHDVMGWY